MPVFSPTVFDSNVFEVGSGPTFTQGTSDTVSLTENLTSDLQEQFEQAVSDTVGLTEAQIRLAARLLSEGLTPSEALATVLNPLDFEISLTAQAQIADNANDFLISLGVIQAALPDFSISLTSLQALPDFSISVRSQPDLRTLFDLDIHRPVGRVEEE